jgi:hypothetical protein
MDTHTGRPPKHIHPVGTLDLFHEYCQKVGVQNQQIAEFASPQKLLSPTRQRY